MICPNLELRLRSFQQVPSRFQSPNNCQHLFIVYFIVSLHSVQRFRKKCHWPPQSIFALHQQYSPCRIIRSIHFHPHFLSISGAANTGSFVNLFFNSLNASSCLSVHSYFLSFLTVSCNGLATDANPSMNRR